MSATSIMSSKCLHTSCVIYKRCLYHPGSDLVLILHKRVRLPPQNAQHLALKLLNRGTFGYKKGRAPLQLCLPSVCAHCMGYRKDVCIIQEWPWYGYSTNKSAYHPQNAQNLTQKTAKKWI